MTVRELREKYLRFFETKGHQRFPSGSLIPYDVTGRLDESLLFNGAGMIQFKPYFRGVMRPESPRLITCQKCVRTGDIETVGDLSHLTFFEMLGNFSFGDYFKAQAIAFIWEFMTYTALLNLDPRRLTFTGFEDDDEAYDEWAFWITPTGLKPENRVFRLGEDTNYWPAGAFSNGPPGPCGPNSEMFYWVADEQPPTGEYTREDWLRDDAAGKWLEIWNDVFIQYEWQGKPKDPSRPAAGFEKESMPPLPFQSIDTGMGLERTATALGGYKSVYETDAFKPIIAVIERLGDGFRYGQDQEQDVAVRIISDHIRTAVFCIADGVLPGNTGRGYVLRRLIRRAVLKGQRALGFANPFFHEVFEGVLQSMGGFYPELTERRELIVETLRNEEALFRRTLKSGLERLEAIVQRAILSSHPEDLLHESPTGIMIDGEEVFRLYDTYGFPLEVTQEIADESGIEIDLLGYERALKEAQERSRGGQERESVYGGVTTAEEMAVEDAPEVTDFVGYTCTEGSSRIVRVRPQAEGRLRVALDRTPFYAESGGQTGDHGSLGGSGFTLSVLNTTKTSGTFWHEIEPQEDIDSQSLLGQEVQAVVHGSRRSRILRNHTATHLLHAALRQVLGTHVTQAGSHVGPDGLRFDFTHGKSMSSDEVTRVERIVNDQVLANTMVQTHADLPIAEARARGAMALFGEKYGDKVRMVEVGEFSRELCGGTHVRSTGEIGLFKIISESSAASGVRRIEAITGESAYEWALDQANTIREAAAAIKASPKELVTAVERLQEQVKDERRRRERAEAASLSGACSVQETADENFELSGGVSMWVRNFGDVDQKIAASALDNAAAGKADFVGLVAVAANGRVNFIAKAGASAVAKGAHAGNLVREVAKIAGGGGGGKAEFATAGGKDAAKAEEALAGAPKILSAMLSVSAD